MAVTAALLAAALAAVAFAREGRHTGPAHELISKAGVAEAFELEAVQWLAGPGPHFAGCGLGLALLLLAFALAAYGGSLWLAVAIAVGSLLGGLGAGEARGVVGPRLPAMAAEAHRRSQKFRAAGDLERAESVARLADWVTRLHRRLPALTMADLEAYRTPVEIADILEGWFFGGTDDFETQRWLGEPPPRPAWESTDEDSRVALLAAVRQELLQGGGTRFGDVERIAELVRQLRAWQSAA